MGEYTKFDGHVHTLEICFQRQYLHKFEVPVSPRKLKGSVEAAIERQVSFAITDHDTIDSYMALKKNEHKGKKIVEDGLLKDLGYALKVKDSQYIICGEEITAYKRTHILAWGIDKAIPPQLSIEETADAIIESGGLVVIPHYGLISSGIGEKELSRIAGKVYALELALSFPFTEWYNRTYDLAEEHGLMVFSGTDAHLPKAIGYQGYTLLEDEIFENRSGKQIIDEMRSIEDTPEVIETPDHSRIVSDKLTSWSDNIKYLGGTVAPMLANQLLSNHGQDR